MAFFTRVVITSILLAAAPFAAAATAPLPATAIRPPHAEFLGETASPDARAVADWVVGSDDNRDLAFIVIDKANARLFLFDGRGRVRATTAVLLGLARGDDSPAGIGDRPLSRISPAERITPAGRFVAEHGENLEGQDILWVDYDAAISLHRATDRKPGLTAKSRSDRLATATSLDNRISHGCINVTPAFFDSFIRPTFGTATGIVYILPETRSARAEFHIPAAPRQATLAAATAHGS